MCWKNKTGFGNGISEKTLWKNIAGVFIVCFYRIAGIAIDYLAAERIDSSRKDERIQRLFDEAVKTIEYILPLYDDDISSNYDIAHITARKIPKVKGDKYHLIHISLLQNLESVSPRPTFEYYIRKWAKMSGFTIK